MFGDFMFGDYSSTNKLMGEVAPASNVDSGSNPDYTLDIFVADFPQFSSVCTGDTPAIPATVSQIFIDAANSCLSYGKYGEVWRLCMGYFVAHECIIFLQAKPSSATTANLVGSATPPMLKTSKGAGDISVSYDVNSIAEDFKGLGTFKYTTYGQQLATWVKMAGMGGAYIR